MISNKSRITSMLTTLAVQEDLTKKGWLVMRGEEESPYDLIVDRGLINGERKFETIQVKTSPRTSSRPSPDSASERVSVGGKTRNSYWYYDEDITYIASVIDGKVTYWEKETYKKLTTGQLKKQKPFIFPINENVISYRRPKNLNDSVTVEDFFG